MRVPRKFIGMVLLERIYNSVPVEERYLRSISNDASCGGGV